MPDVILHFDGACFKNPGGVAAYGWLLSTEFGVRIVDGSGVAARDCPTATNNVAEYTALLEGLTWLIGSTLDPCELLVRGDSNLVVQQLNGKWNCNAPHLRELRDRCLDAIHRLKGVGWTVQLEWIGREQNVLADELSRLAWEKATGRIFPEIYAMKRR